MPDAPQDTIPAGEAPTDTPKVPSTRAPVGACDAHVHMLAGPGERGMNPSRSEDPAPGRRYEDWMRLFREHLDNLGCTRTVIVQSILYGTDNDVTVETVRSFEGAARGIALVSEEASENHLDDLAENGIVGVRLNYVHGGVLTWEGAKRLAPRLAARGMHLQMLLHADRHMEEVAADVADLPVPLVLDHVGWPTDLSKGTGEPGFDRLRGLVGDGHVHVKLSGIYRMCEAPYDAADPFVAALAEANPEACLWGSDWPHIMLRDASMPDAGVLLDAFMRAVPGTQARQTILVDAPARLYGFS